MAEQEHTGHHVLAALSRGSGLLGVYFSIRYMMDAALRLGQPPAEGTLELLSPKWVLILCGAWLVVAVFGLVAPRHRLNVVSVAGSMQGLMAVLLTEVMGL